MRRTIPPALFGCLVFSMGADQCTAEVSTETTAGDWDVADTPEPRDVILPMTCEWLEEDNCWKRFVARAQRCIDAEARGTLTPEGNACTYASGATLELGRAIDPPMAGQTLYPILDWRVLDDEAAPCVTGKIIGLGRSIVSIGDEAVLFESPNITGTVHMTCDGVTYGNDASGTCGTYGGEYLAQRVPGVVLACRGDDSTCALTLTGGPEGPAQLTTCDWE